ncbi:MAG: hypothetical protein NXH95_10820 [Pseudomonadaceae bacterium]|nr:hypothetical protein [Pseudomonadaceae bacterium]
MSPGLRVFFGHHKCASRYFRFDFLGRAANTLEWPTVRYQIKNPPFHFRRLDDLDLFNIDFDALKDMETGLLVFSNASVRVLEKFLSCDVPYRGLRVFRDPRQLLVSNFYHHLDGHNTATENWVWDKLIEDRVVMSGLEVVDGIHYELNNISRELFDTQIFGWESPQEVLDVRLENFESDPKTWSEAIAEHLQIPAEILSVPENRFSNPRRKEWPEVMGRRSIDLFKQR